MLYQYDIDLKKRHDVDFVIGVDEAGRGPLAGPVVAAAVVLDLTDPISGINDSKALREPERRRLASTIMFRAIYTTCTVVAEEEIDRINILQATLKGMHSCVEPWADAESILIAVDGNQSIPGIGAAKHEAIIKGDAKSASIAAASIMAKVCRDRIMVDSAKRYPMYEFDKHKGYPTKKHIELIRRWGTCELHRQSFCKKFIGDLN